MDKISVIIPCYFNEQNMPATTAALLENEQLFPAGVSFEYVLVDDGSKDGTLAALHVFQARYPQKVTVIKLAGNFGSYNAILAGMQYATGNCHIVISADLQDPPALMLPMYTYWKQGIKLVIANRKERNDGFPGGFLASIYCKLIRKYALPDLPEGGFDYCLFDEQLRQQVIDLKEKNTNTLYLLLRLKDDFVTIPYTRRHRQTGKSRWTFRKKIRLAVDSFISFSGFPLRLITMGGLCLGSIAILYAIYIIFIKPAVSVEGRAIMIVMLLLLSAFQAIGIGILVQYLRRNSVAGRRRPAYIVDTIIAAIAPIEEASG